LHTVILNEVKNLIEEGFRFFANAQNDKPFLSGRLKTMRNPTRRNKNIGTAKQGHGQNNALTLPRSGDKVYYEKLVDPVAETRTVNGHAFLFVTEKTKPEYQHACSVDDIIAVIAAILKEDYGDLRFIVLRQPKRKEEILSAVWGRFVPAYAFGKETAPAIILEAVNYKKPFKCSKKLSVEWKKEIDRLVADGHKVTDDGRNYIIHCDLNSVRNTQLYRTLPHEFGHYVHYCAHGREQWSNLPRAEKKAFAHAYAARVREGLARES